MSETRTLKVVIAGDAKSAREALKVIGGGLEEADSKTGKSKASWDGYWGGVNKVLGGVALGIGGAVAGVGMLGIKTASSLEQSKNGFTTMLGSAQAAETFLAQLQKFAATTPFELQGVTQSSQQLLAMGFQAKDVIPTMTAVGDAVSALGGGQDKINQVVLALGQMKAKGKVAGDEMLQLTEAGIPAWEMLSKKMGVDIPTAMKQVSAGAVDSNMAIGALTTGMESKFGGLMEKQSHTMAGLWSNLTDNISQSAAKIVQPLVPLIEKHMPKLVDFAGKAGDVIAQKVVPAVEKAVKFFGDMAKFVKQNRDWIEPLAVALGTGAAAIYLIVTAVKVWTAVQSIFNAVMDANPIGIIIVFLAALVAGLVYAFNHNKAFHDAVMKTWNAIKGAVKAVVDWFKTDVPAAWNWVKEHAIQIWNSVKDFFISVWNGIRDFFVGIWNGIVNVVKTVWGWIYSYIKFWIELVVLVVKSYINAVLTVIKTVLGVIKAVWEFIWSAIGDNVKRTWDRIVAGLERVWGWIKDGFNMWLNGIKAVWEWIWSLIGDKVKAVWDWIVGTIGYYWNLLKVGFQISLAFLKNLWETIWGAISGAVSAVWDWIVGVVKGAFNWVVAFIKTYLNTLWAIWSAIWNAIAGAAIAVWDWIKNAISSAIKWVSNLISNILNTISSTWHSVWSGLGNAVAGAWNWIKNAVHDGIWNLLNVVSSLPGKIMDAIGDLGSFLFNSGKKLIQGLIDGVKHMAGALKDAASGVLGGIGNLFPHSPAKEGPFSGKGWTLYSGQALVEGFADGISSKGGQVHKAMGAVMGDTHDAMSGDLASGSLSAPGGGVNVTVNVSGSVTAERDLAKSIAITVRDEIARNGKRNGGKTGLG